MNRLSRRELLRTLLGAELAATLAAACEGERGAQGELDGGFVDPAYELGHRLRETLPPDEAFASAPARRVDVAVVGGGPAGLSAIWRLRRRGLSDVALLELEARPGGTSLYGHSGRTDYPWGAHYITTPMAHQRALIALLREMDALEDPGVGDRGSPHPVPREELRVREPAERLFYKGYWYPGLFLRAGADARDFAELARFEGIVDYYARLRDAAGRRAFALPRSAGSDDAELVALDRMSAAQWLALQGFRSVRLLWLLDYACRDDYGLRLRHTSAWALLFYFACRRDPEHAFTAEPITWPQGNGALVSHLARAARGRVLANRVVLEVVPPVGASPSSVPQPLTLHVYDGRADCLERVLARRVIVAAPRFVARRIVRPLRERPSGDADDFQYGAWMVANLRLHSRPRGRGVEAAWDNVLYDSPALGYVTATHQRGRSFGPTVWTYYLPLTDARAGDGRRRLFGCSYEQCREVVLADLRRAHPDLDRHTAGVDIRRWGHGMVQPRPGTLWSAARARAAEPLLGVHFAHSDLSGLALFEEAFDHGVRAADEVADAWGLPRLT